MAIQTTTSERNEFGNTCAVCGAHAGPSRTIIYTLESRETPAPACCVPCLLRVVIHIGRQTLARVAQ